MDQLRPSTVATLMEIKNFPWFSKVGSRDPDVSTAVVVSNWYEAISSVESEDWENLCLDAANGYAERLSITAPSRFRGWNEKVEAVKRTTVPLIDTLFSSRTDLRSLPKVVLDTVQWDILSVCLEAEFSDCIPPGFHASNSYWYRVGHFPCGWRGKFPEGRPIIY